MDADRHNLASDPRFDTFTGLLHRRNNAKRTRWTVVSEPDGVASYRFSIDSLPERDRVAYWRESFGRKVMHLDMEPVEEEPLRFEITRHRLGDIAVISARTSGHCARRTPGLLADSNDDQVLVIPAHRAILALVGFPGSVRPQASYQILRS